ncbi:hypothetical protein NPA31_008085 [Aurantimonas sp. MSK8Z-1]|uniref:hypothetical protein n=1 Tax=Mangrovibrevibacter kandeliae TaxID=2968473 RepID=UPI00211926CF|nr:hypothetical protein [Aurantimonas sp. MSK8Z-1]MCW4114914.1 hypothetical protein [Aurantimonas sp. MSK8Z-1]
MPFDRRMTPAPAGDPETSEPQARLLAHLRGQNRAMENLLKALVEEAPEGAAGPDSRRLESRN